MPNIGGSVQDELLRLTGTTGQPFENISANGNGSGVYFGADRLVEFRLLIAGAVTGTTPTLDIKIQDSADNSSFADIGAAFPQQTATEATVVGNLVAPPRLAVRTKVGRPYLRIVKTLGGTTPVFNSVAVLHDFPMDPAP
jgi:hypothetical protein